MLKSCFISKIFGLGCEPSRFHPFPLRSFINYVTCFPPVLSKPLLSFDSGFRCLLYCSYIKQYSKSVNLNTTDFNTCMLSKWSCLSIKIRLPRKSERSLDVPWTKELLYLSINYILILFLIFKRLYLMTFKISLVWRQKTEEEERRRMKNNLSAFGYDEDAYNTFYHCITYYYSICSILTHIYIFNQFHTNTKDSMYLHLLKTSILLEAHE